MTVTDVKIGNSLFHQDGMVMDEMRRSKLGPVSVILPAFNEEDAVGAQVDAIRRILVAGDVTHEIVVVDDGSHDQTAAEAAKSGARVLRHAENRGYGASIKSGILAASHDTIVISDADGTYPAEEIPSLLSQLATADMVVGARVGKEVHIPRVRRPAKWLLGKLASHISGQRIPDLNSGLRAFRRECVQQYFSVLSDRFSFTTTVTLALLADNYRVVYHPINYHRRIGKSKIEARHFMDFTILVLRMSMMFQPLKIFVPWAAACGCLGLLKAIFDVAALFARHSSMGLHLLHQPVLSTSATLLLLTGLQLLLVGMVADGLLRRIAQNGMTLVPSHGVTALEYSVNGNDSRDKPSSAPVFVGAGDRSE